MHLLRCGVVMVMVLLRQPGDFAGAIALVCLNLGGNAIVAVAASAFHNLQAMRVQPEEYNPQLPDGNGSYVNAAGVGTCLVDVACAFWCAAHHATRGRAGWGLAGARCTKSAP